MLRLQVIPMVSSLENDAVWRVMDEMSRLLEAENALYDIGPSIVSLSQDQDRALFIDFIMAIT